MKYLSFAALAYTLGTAVVADAKVTAQSRDIIVLQGQDLPELAQSPGQSMALHSFSNGNTYLYVEQNMGTKLAVFDVTNPAHIRPVGTVTLNSPSAFNFVRDLDDSTALVCFRNNKGAAVLDFRKPKEPSLVLVESLRQAAHAEMIGNTGLLMVAQPRHDDDTPLFDFQIADTSNPRRLKLLTTVVQVQQKLYDSTPGATYLLGAGRLTVIRHPRVEERHRSDLTSN